MDPAEPQGPSAAAPAGRAGLRAWALRGGRAAITALALGWVWSRLPEAGLAEIGAALPRWTLLVPSTAMAINTVLLAERHRAALAVVGHRVQRVDLVLLHLRSAFAALVLPRGGADLTRIAVLSRQTGDLEGVLAAALHLRVVDLALWVCLLLLFLAQGPWPGLRALELAAAAVILAGVGVLIGLPIVIRVAGGWVGRLPWIGARALRVVDALRAAAGAGGASLRIAALGVPMAIGNIASVSVLFWAAGVEVPLGRQVGLVPAMDAVLSVPITVGGVGLRESVFILVGESLGLAAPVALAIAWTRWTGELSRGLLGGLSLLIAGGWGARRHGET